MLGRLQGCVAVMEKTDSGKIELAVKFRYTTKGSIARSITVASFGRSQVSFATIPAVRVQERWAKRTVTDPALLTDVP